MLRSGAATSAENGPSLGRGMGVGATDEAATSNGPMQEMPGMSHGEHGAMQMASSEVSKDANRVPGFPQDAFMESPMMAMDKMVEKPETYGLRAGWSGYMQGMMTFLRVLPPEMYDKIAALREQDNRKPHMQMMEHPNHE